jgi:D-alanyl-D-alanine carboxypeptidase
MMGHLVCGAGRGVTVTALAAFAALSGVADSVPTVSAGAGTFAAQSVLGSATTEAPPTTTAVVSDTTDVTGVADESNTTAQFQRVVDDAVNASPSIPGVALHVEAPAQDLDVSVAAGVADRATAAPLQPDSGFRIASNTKTFTAAAILRLVEQDALSLDAVITGLLAGETVDALRADGYRPDAITVRELLLHTSGIYDYAADPAFQTAVVADPAKRWTRLEQVRFAMDHGAPAGDAGEVFAYSDTGYILLGEMIERATGTSLADAYRTLLDFDGLGIEATYLESVEPVPPGSAARAHQYFDELDTFDFDPSFDLYGGGGLVSTVDDLSAFYRALLRGEVFTDPGTLDMMLDIPSSNAGSQAGMGIFRLYVEGNECWSHGGFWGTFVLTCPDLDVTIAASWGQALPDAQFNAETVFQRAFQLATSP